MLYLPYYKHELVHMGKFFRKLKFNLLSADIALFLTVKIHLKLLISFLVKQLLSQSLNLPKP